MNEVPRKDIHTTGVPVLCLACEARHKGICGALTPEQLVKLNKHASRTVHETSDELFGGALGNETYANILSGVIKLTKIMPDGRQQIVGLQFAPDFLGRPFDKDPQLVAEAATNVRLCTFPKPALEQIIKESPDLEHRLHQQALRELDEAREWMLTLGRKSAIEKVASFLLLIASHIDPEHEPEGTVIRIELPLKRMDIADFLGLTVETVSRQLTNLRKHGIIELSERKAVIISSIAKLKAVSNHGL